MFHKILYSNSYFTSRITNMLHNRSIRKCRLLRKPNYFSASIFDRRPIVLQAKWIPTEELIDNDSWQVSKIEQIKDDKGNILFKTIKTKRCRRSHHKRSRHKRRRSTHIKSKSKTKSRNNTNAQSTISTNKENNGDSNQSAESHNGGDIIMRSPNKQTQTIVCDFTLPSNTNTNVSNESLTKTMDIPIPSDFKFDLPNVFDIDDDNANNTNTDNNAYKTTTTTDESGSVDVKTDKIKHENISKSETNENRKRKSKHKHHYRYKTEWMDLDTLIDYYQKNGTKALDQYCSFLWDEGKYDQVESIMHKLNQKIKIVEYDVCIFEFAF